MRHDRLSRRATRYDKDDYLVPDDKVVSVVEALVEDRDKLKDFGSYRQDTGHIRDVFVCSHGSNNTCCATFGYPIYKELRNRYARELDGRLRVVDSVAARPAPAPPGDLAISEEVRGPRWRARGG